MVRGSRIVDLRRPAVKIVVDRGKCIGAANCVGMAPGAFKLDPEKKALVVRPDAHDDNTLFEAAESCPTEAIALYNDTGEQIFP
jgi:ferredoxin